MRPRILWFHGGSSFLYQTEKSVFLNHGDVFRIRIILCIFHRVWARRHAKAFSAWYKIGAV